MPGLVVPGIVVPGIVVPGIVVTGLVGAEVVIIGAPVMTTGIWSLRA